MLVLNSSRNYALKKYSVCFPLRQFSKALLFFTSDVTSFFICSWSKLCTAQLHTMPKRTKSSIFFFFVQCISKMWSVTLFWFFFGPNKTVSAKCVWKVSNCPTSWNGNGCVENTGVKFSVTEDQAAIPLWVFASIMQITLVCFAFIVAKHCSAFYGLYWNLFGNSWMQLFNV